MNKGYIKIGGMYITIWRVLIWAVMLFTFIVLSPIIVPLGLLTIIFILVGVIGERLMSISSVIGAIVGDVFANKFNVSLVNSLVEKHKNLMPWAKTEGEGNEHSK